MLLDRYRIDALLGEGAMGRVYLGEHLVLKNKLAIKVLLPEMSKNEEVVKRFEREAHAAGNLSHPNIARATDFGQTPDGRIFLVLEYVPGPSLLKVLSGGQTLPPDRACKVARQMLSALVHAHGKGVVHRDLKPENVVLLERADVAEKDVVKILDFGIAKVTAPEGDGAPLTRLGLVYGTPQYLSPEQALGRAIDHRADLYAVGVILYEMLVGRRPFESPEQVTLLLAHAHQEPPPPSQFGPIPTALEALVLKLLSKSPDDRFADAKSTLAALDAADPSGGGRPSRVDARAVTVAVAGTPSVAGRPLPAWLKRAMAWARESPPRAIAAGVGGLCLFVGLILVLSSGGDDEWTTTTAPVAGSSVPGAPLEPTERADVPPPPGARRSLVELQALVDASPNDGVRRRDLGAGWARAGDLAQAVRHYTEALRLDPSLRADPTVHEDLVDALSSQRVWSEARSLLVGTVGSAAMPALLSGAVEDHRMRVRQRSREILTSVGAALPPFAQAAFALDDARTCEDRSAAIARIREVGDARLLAVLRRRQRDRRGMDRQCDSTELAGAIAMFGG